MNNEEIKQKIQSIFVSPEATARAVDAIVLSKKKPSTWSRRSNAAYYGEEYAKQIAKQLDAMMIDRQPRMYKYSEWPSLQPNTIYLRINQSIRYLLEFLDTDGKYRRFLQVVKITRERTPIAGVLLRIIAEFQEDGSSNFEPTAVIEQREMPKWKQKMENWLDTAEPGGEPFILEGLLLSGDEVKQLKLQFVGLKNIMASISATHIKLLMINT